VERNPRSGHLMAQWGVFLIKAGKPRDALDKFYMALQLDSFDDAGLYHAIANLHQEQGEKDKARRAYLKALEIQPRSVGTQLDYAEMLLANDDGRAALAILETAFRTIRASGAKRVFRAYASYLSSKAHLMLGEREMALLAVSRAMEDNDQDWLVPTLQAQRQAVLSV
jgi:tetratricopeptide (TPR) repeat protein